MNTAVSPDHAPFSSGRLSRFQRPVIQLDHSCPIIGVNQIFEGGLCPPKSSRQQVVHRLKFRCPSIHPRLNIPFKSSYASGLLRQSQPFLACTESLFCMLTFGNVSNNDGEEPLTARLNLGDGSLYWEFFPSRSQPPECAQTVQRAIGDPTLGKAMDTRAVSGAEAFGDEAFDGNPDCFIRRTREYFFRCCIEQYDPLRIIDRDDRVHSRPDDARQQIGAVT